MTLQWSQCFKKIFQQYCQNTGLHCWKYFINKKLSKEECILWGIMQLIAISSAGYLFYAISDNYWKAPIITTLESTNYRIKNIPFPAVAICDVNRISYANAVEFSKDRSIVYNTTLEKMLLYVKYLGRLYDYDEEDIEIVHEFNRILDASKNNVQFDYMRFTNVMLNLTPSMNHTLLECMWNSQIINCEDIFTFRRTMNGFCAIFNHVKSSKHVFLKTAFPKNKVNSTTQHAAGSQMGLKVLVRSNSSDYYYPLVQIEGVKVFIYNSHDYPDVESGALVESFVPLNTEVFLQIAPVTVTAVDMIRTYSASQRQCLFSDELTTAFDAEQYSYSDCISECRALTILALCECVPFYMSINTELSYSRQLCSLGDIPCLNKFKEKWSKVALSNRNTMTDRDLASEAENSIECSHCLPECAFTKYRVYNEYTPLVNTNYPLLKNHNLSDVSLIHIYFNSDTTMMYKSDLIYYWFDIISNFGGIFSVFLGFSLISLIEIFYFFVFRYIIMLINTKK